MHTTLRCLLADDDSSSRTVLRDYIDRHADLTTVEVCENGVEVANTLFEAQVDLVFMDVEMPEMSGLELVERLSDVPPTVVVTDHEEYAVEAFEVGVIDYLLKPVPYPRFLEAVERVSNWIQGRRHTPTEANGAAHNGHVPDASAEQDGPPRLVSPRPENVFLKDGRRLIRVDLGDIQWIKAQGDYMLVRAGKERYMINSTMKELEKKLPSDQFIRIHRSHIVRIDQIKDIEDTTLIIDGKMLPIGPSYQNDLIDQIQTL